MSTMRIRPTVAAMKEPVGDPHFLPRDPKNLLHAQPSRRVAVTFKSVALTLAGHLYRPNGIAPEKRTPGIVMVGPISSVKEQTVPHYAERFADAGYTVLTFDSRNFGESEGQPRFHYDPNQVIEDYCNAVSHLMTTQGVDPGRIAVAGVCMGGGYAVSVGARDKRIKAVVSVAGGYNIGGTFQQLLGVEGFAAYYAKINELVTKQYRTGEVQYIPTIAQTPKELIWIDTHNHIELYDQDPYVSEAARSVIAWLNPYLSP